MDENHPVSIDKRPKRRKSKDNPYTIFTTGVGNGDPHYYISFSDTQGDTIKLEISKELFEQFDQWELEDISVLHEHERHYEHSELTDSTLNRRALYKELIPEERVVL